MSMGDEASAAGNSARFASGSRWGRVLPALLLVASATFVAAYYVPLRRAHVLLVEEYQKSSQKSTELEQTLSQVRGELQAKAAQADQLEAERRKVEAAKKSGAEQGERLKTELAGKLDNHIKKGTAAVAVVEGRALVALAESAAFLPNTLDVSPHGRLLVCDVARTLATSSDAPLSVGAVSDPKAPAPPALQAAHPTPWALSAARAASIAQLVEEKCGVPGARLSAVGHGAHDPAAAALAGSKLPPGRIELAIALPGNSHAAN